MKTKIRKSEQRLYFQNCSKSFVNEAVNYRSKSLFKIEKTKIGQNRRQLTLSSKVNKKSDLFEVRTSFKIAQQWVKYPPSVPNPVKYQFIFDVKRYNFTCFSCALPKTFFAESSKSEASFVLFLQTSMGQSERSQVSRHNLKVILY